MIVCYLDDSGTGEEPILNMSGYVATDSQWSEFELAARDIFNKFDISELHAKEFNDTKDQFKGWPRRRKEALALSLYAELRRCRALGIDSGITRAAYQRARHQFGHEPNESRYGNCFKWIIETIMQSDMMKFYAAAHKATLTFVVEAGNKNDADIRRVFDQMKFNPNHRGVVEVMKTVEFVEKGSSIALQMADFLAFHSRRYKSQCEKARRYLPLTDLQRLIFKGIDTKTNLSYEYRTNEEIAAGYKDPNSWRREIR
ncbi:hypothetical protein ACVWYJ_006948 [Bradyrhizobium sp. USDA 4471]